MNEISSEQRARDGRLAWLIVLGCAAATIALVALAVTLLVGPAKRAAEAKWQDAMAVGIVRQNADKVIPPDTAVPIGVPASWIRPDNRPVVALARGEHGDVRVTLAIDTAGVPTGCAVARSSGFDGLDNGTCLALMKAGRFRPARRGEPGTGPGEVRRWTSPVISWNKH